MLASLGAGLFLLWHLRVEVTLVFAGGLFGTALFRVSEWLSDRTRLPYKAAVILFLLAGVLTASGTAILVGQRLSSQYSDFDTRLPDAIQAVEARIEGVPLLGSLRDQLAALRRSATGESGTDAPEPEQPSGLPSGMRIASVTMSTLSYLAFVVFFSAFVALDARRYGRALLRLVPRPRREVARETLAAVTSALPWWLAGRLASMAIVGVLTAVGLALLGIPLAMLLGLIAALFSFVPVIGPLASVFPAALIALTADPGKVPWVLGLFAVVQFAESWLITPVIQQRVTSVPPVLLLAAQLVAGVAVGFVGIMFSTPLALTLMLIVQVVWVRHALGEPITVPALDDAD